MSDDKKNRIMTQGQATLVRDEFLLGDDLDPSQGIWIRAALKRDGYKAKPIRLQILRALEMAFMENIIHSRSTPDPSLEARYNLERGDIVVAMTNLITESYTKGNQPIGEHVANLFAIHFATDVERIINKHAPRRARSAA